jgi:hypothetical protein
MADNNEKAINHGDIDYTDIHSGLPSISLRPNCLRCKNKTQTNHLLKV